MVFAHHPTVRALQCTILLLLQTMAFAHHPTVRALQRTVLLLLPLFRIRHQVLLFRHRGDGDKVVVNKT
jgi:hypothetical protein